jgi:hypothetical protein
MAAVVPLGGSQTEWARRYLDIRQRGMAARIFKTLRFLLRNSTWIGNFIAMVWTLSQGVIQSPSPDSSRLCFNKPIFRFLLISAIPARSASRVPLD